MKTILLILILSLGTFAQVPHCTSTGQAFWTVTPYLSQIYGCAGGGKTEVSLLLQGYVGVAELTASQIRFNGTIVYNGYELVIGPPDSAGPGHRTFVLSNDPVPEFSPPFSTLGDTVR